MLRVGVIGAGLVAQAVHLPHLADLGERFAVAGLVDPDASTRASVARRHGIDRAFDDHADLLAAGGLDVVLVCSPNATHAEIVLDALAAGMHVLVEKPLALTVAEADRIVAERDRTGLVVQVGYMKRFDPAFEALLDDLEADPPEPLHLAAVTYDPGLAADFGAGGRPAGPVDLRSDVFLGALIHDVNAVHGVLERLGRQVPGRVVDAFARADGAAAGGTLAFGDLRCTLAWLRIDGLHDFRERIALYGAADIRELEFPAPYLRGAPTRYRRTASGRGGNVAQAFRSWRESYARQLEHFHDCVVHGTPCRTPPEQSRADIACLTAMYEAAA
jgi:predicted dehydrogenase